MSWKGLNGFFFFSMVDGLEYAGLTREDRYQTNLSSLLFKTFSFASLSVLFLQKITAGRPIFQHL